MIKKFTLILVLLVWGSTSSWAKTDKTQKELLHCYKVTDNLTRLACYDQIASAFIIAPISIVKPPETIKAPATLAVASTTETTKTISQKPATSVVSQTEQTQTDVVDNFGQKHLKKVIPEDDQTIEFVIATIKKLAFDNLQFTFENGQMWRQKDSVKIKLRVGDAVKLSYGFGSVIYLQKVGKNKRIKVKRIN